MHEQTRRKFSMRKESLKSVLKAVLKYCHICFLFTASDFKTIVIPNTIFGITGALSRSLFTGNPHRSISDTLSRTHLAVLWIWLNLLPFNINNQRQPEGIAEDLINKPWRPLPSKLITPKCAKALMQIHYIVALIGSLYLGGWVQCLNLLFLGFWYNNYGGSDSSFLVRNFINAAGYLSFVTGAINVFNGHLNFSFSEKGYSWLCIVGFLIFSTVQMQDLPDQAGDILRDRKTLPLVVGDGNARWIVAIALGFWSYVVPTFWDAGFFEYVSPVVLGLYIIRRVLTRRTRAEDALTFKFWNVWVVILYVQPLISQESLRLFGA